MTASAINSGILICRFRQLRGYQTPDGGPSQANHSCHARANQALTESVR